MKRGRCVLIKMFLWLFANICLHVHRHMGEDLSFTISQMRVWTENQTHSTFFSTSEIQVSDPLPNNIIFRFPKAVLPVTNWHVLHFSEKFLFGVLLISLIHPLSLICATFVFSCVFLSTLPAGFCIFRG